MESLWAVAYKVASRMVRKEMQSPRQLTLLSVLYGSSLTACGPFVSPFPASLGTVDQNILVLYDKTVSLTSFWINLSNDRCRIKVAYDILCS